MVLLLLVTGEVLPLALHYATWGHVRVGLPGAVFELV